jgi:hypothetical protein
MRAMHGMHRYFIQNSFVSMFVSLISLDPRNIGVDDLIDIHLAVPDRLETRSVRRGQSF